MSTRCSRSPPWATPGCSTISDRTTTAWSIELSMRQVVASDEKVVLDVVMVKDGERIRIWSSHTADGSVLVQDGTIASARDQQTRWAGRCGERRAEQPNSPRE